MSQQYPYGFGQPQGPQSTTPYGFQPGAYPPQPFNHHNSTSVNRNISQASFDYNASNIPGLGIANPPAAPSSHSMAPNPSFWISSSAQGLPQRPPSFATTSETYQGGAYGGGRFNAAGAPAQPAALQTQTTSVDAEEGELSDGQFEDLYEPREIVEPEPTSKPVLEPSSAASFSGPNSAVDTPEAGFYGNDDDDGGLMPQGNNTARDARERSGSYSPFLSPREIRTENTTPPAVLGNGAKPPPFQYAASIPLPKPPVVGFNQGHPHRPPVIQNAVVPGLHITPSQVSKVPPDGKQAKPGPLIPKGPKKNSGPFASVQELRKEAQKAILGLLPIGVKYQTYVDEGFEKSVIKALFQDLHLDMPKSPTQASKDLPPPTKPNQDKASLVKSAPSKEQSGSGAAATPTADRAGEERKDKIARLLAAKAAKAASVTASSEPVAAPKPAAVAPPPLQNTNRPPSPVKTKVWGEKELILKQKLAALQKSRETQKAAPSPAANTVDSPGSQVDNQHSLAPSKPDVARSEVDDGGPQAGTIPGLLFSGSQAGQTASQRKRPVAADFVEYSSTVGPLKRPFGQDRKETSLIIDVSDGSDDDVDMDMGSPVEEHTMLRGGPSTQRGPSVRDFPPLSEGPPGRQFSSPAKLSQTPPGSSILTRRRETELDLKEREIQEMRRKIAEAEAKRKVKQHSGSQTPQQGNTTPNSSNMEAPRPPLGRRAPSSSDGPSAQLMLEASSAKLPKLSERVMSSQSPRAQFKARIVSQDLPRLKESVEEKRMRLKKLQEEQERLEAELDQQLAEEKLLEEQLEEIEAQPSESDSQPNGTRSSDDSGHVSANEGHAVLSAAASAHETSSGSLDERADDDISMDEDPSSRESSVRGDDVIPNAAGTGAAGATSDVALTMPPRATAAAHPPSPSAIQDGHVATPEPVTTDPSEPDRISSDGYAPEPDTTPAQPDVKSGTMGADETSPMEIESPSQSPAPVESISDQTPTDEEAHEQSRRQSSSPLRISDVAEPREIIQEIERGTVREVNIESSPKQERAFAPYETPLRYFHAYRYHPSYSQTVSGGLRSLTYSNRIDAKNPLCPYELGGQQCPPGCQFQHFASITPPEDQILVELGRADDFTGEEKNKFIQGLREVLQGFRANKVKDFDAIARGIIEYRSRFLGDKSRVLPLQGVSI